MRPKSKLGNSTGRMVILVLAFNKVLSHEPDVDHGCSFSNPLLDGVFLCIVF